MRFKSGFLFFVCSLAGLIAACLHFRPLPAKIEDKVQPLYAALQRIDPNASYLFIAIDGVPYDLVRDLQEQGYFKSFAPASRLISTFPSTTIVGFTGLLAPLGCDLPQGYETKFFSESENRLRGYTPHDYHAILIPFKQFFHYYRYSLWNKLTMYATPGATVRRDLERIRNEALQAKEPFLRMAYIGGTDGAAHVLGRERLIHLLKTTSRDLEETRREFAARRGRPLHLFLYSDHGFQFSDNLQSISVEMVRAALERRDFTLAHHLKNRREFVPVPFGNLSSGVFYSLSADAQEIAATLSQVPGVDLSFYSRSPDEIGVVSHVGTSARIQVKDGGKSFRYLPTNGDPLNYSPLLSVMNPARAFLDPSPWLSADSWWNVSKENVYPDALSRLYDAFETLTVNRAQVMLSTLPDFEYGSTEARIGAGIHSGLKGTHGALFKSASSAIAMTTIPNLNLPATVSYRELFQWIVGVGATGWSPMDPVRAHGRAPLP